jgi:MarR family transcriptional regulator, organic hydroperoxide resistance regulator
MYKQFIIIFAAVMDKCYSEYCGCLYYSTNALARIMTRMAEEEFANTGLAPSYAFILMSVNAKPGIQPKELSDHMLLMASTVTRLVEKLEYKGFVKRKYEGRNTEVYPTTKSLNLDPAIKTSWQNLYKRYSKLIGKEESKNLTFKINHAINAI